jgi:hypothetical protein
MHVVDGMGEPEESDDRPEAVRACADPVNPDCDRTIAYVGVPEGCAQRASAALAREDHGVRGNEGKSGVPVDRVVEGAKELRRASSTAGTARVNDGNPDGSSERG